MLTPDHAHVLAGQGLAGQLQALLLGPAGPAPGRPEVQHQGLAAQAGQVDPLVVEGPAGEGGQGLALALGHHGHARADLLHLPGAGLGGQARSRRRRPARPRRPRPPPRPRPPRSRWCGAAWRPRLLDDPWIGPSSVAADDPNAMLGCDGRGTIGSLDVEASGVSLVRPKDEGERWIKLTLVTMGDLGGPVRHHGRDPVLLALLRRRHAQVDGPLHRPLRLRRAGPAPAGDPRRDRGRSGTAWPSAPSASASTCTTSGTPGRCRPVRRSARPPVATSRRRGRIDR